MAQLSNVERDFILSALRDGNRADGRTVHQRRRVHFQLERTDARCLAEVCWGQTRVVTVVTAEVVSPFPDRPTEGFLTFHPELSPMASPSFETGRPSAAAIELGRVLERLFRDARAIDTEALCIVAGEKVWSLRCEIHVLDHGGNLIDASALATMAALRHFRRREVTVDGARVTIHPYTERAPVPLSIHHTPVTISFGLFSELGQELLDPTDREEQVALGTLTLGLNAHGELCLLHKPGGAALSPEDLIRCTRLASVQARALIEELETALRIAEEEEQAKARRLHAEAAGYLPLAAASDRPRAGGSSSGAHPERVLDIFAEVDRSRQQAASDRGSSVPAAAAAGMARLTSEFLAQSRVGGSATGAGRVLSWRGVLTPEASDDAVARADEAKRPHQNASEGEGTSGKDDAARDPLDQLFGVDDSAREEFHALAEQIGQGTT